MYEPISAFNKYAEGPRPFCECHGEPMSWNPSKRSPSGGSWRCKAARRAHSLAANRKRGMAPNGSEEHLTRFRKGRFGLDEPSTKSSAIHAWLSKSVPKTGVCRQCSVDVGVKRPGGTEYAFLKHPEQYTRDVNDYIELCPSCHRAKDAHESLARALSLTKI